MANSAYLKFKQSLLSQSPSVDLDTDTIKAVLVTSAYVFDAGHQFLSSVGVPARVATSSALVGVSITDGVFDATNVTFAAVPAGSTITAVILFKDTGVDATSPLICYLDSSTAGLPLQTGGNDIVVRWSNGASKIFALV